MARKRQRRAASLEDRESMRVGKAITTPSLENGGKLHPASFPGPGMLDMEPRKKPPKAEEEEPEQVPAKPTKKAAAQMVDDISKIRDVKSYDPRKVTDAVLRDDFRIVLAWYATWKKDPDNFEHSEATIRKLLKLILKEAVKRGPKVIRFNPDGMASSVRSFFKDVASEVRVPEPMFKQLTLAPDDDPSDFTNKELLAAHVMLHVMFREHATKGWSAEDIVNLHARLVDEMVDREIKHPPPPDDGLDDASEDFESAEEEEEPVKKRFAVVNSSGVERGPEITLKEVLKHFQTFKLRKPYIYIVGGLANHGKTKGDIDIVVRDTENLPKEFRHALEFRLLRALPAELADRTEVHYDRFHGPFTNHVALYDLTIERMDNTEVIEMRNPGQPEHPETDPGFAPAQEQIEWPDREEAYKKAADEFYEEEEGQPEPDLEE